MKTEESHKQVRCAIYTRKSVTVGLEQDFNSLDAQREAAESFIKSQAGEGWVCLPQEYSDGGFTGSNTARPGVQRLLRDVEAGEIDCIVVYKVDRLSRSLMDFSRMMEILEKSNCSFVSVTQQFNTSHSMGRLTLNILLSFAQFEREIISERTRDKVHAARRKGKWTGGYPVLGYDIAPDKRLVVNPSEAERVRSIYDLYLQHEATLPVVKECQRRCWTTKKWLTRRNTPKGGLQLNKNRIHGLLTNPIYTGRVKLGNEILDGEHEAIIDISIYERVRALMNRNCQSSGKRVRNRHGALLRGLLYDAKTGYALAHTFTKSNNKLYRYYVNTQASMMGWDTCKAATASVPAVEIENFVLDRIKAIGRDPQLQQEILEEVALDQMGSKERMTEKEVLTALETFDPLWEQMAPLEQARLVELLIEKVLIDSEAGTVAITFRPNGIDTLLKEACA